MFDGGDHRSTFDEPAAAGVYFEIQPGPQWTQLEARIGECRRDWDIVSTQITTIASRMVAPPFAQLTIDRINLD
jgi:hypothetical protein